jgi:hypothetical protein
LTPAQAPFLLKIRPIAYPQPAADRFTELLLSDELPLQISVGNLDYPTVSGLSPSLLIKDWGNLRTDSTPWSTLGTFVPAASGLMKEVDYN